MILFLNLVNHVNPVQFQFRRFADEENRSVFERVRVFGWGGDS